MTTAVRRGDMRANMAREKRNDWKEMNKNFLVLQGLIKTVFYPVRLQWSNFSSVQVQQNLAILKEALATKWLFQGL